MATSPSVGSGARRRVHRVNVGARRELPRGRSLSRERAGFGAIEVYSLYALSIGVCKQLDVITYHPALYRFPFTGPGRSVCRDIQRANERLSPMIMRSETNYLFAGQDTTARDHDAGLEHGHDWARERTGIRRHAPTVADASTARTRPAASPTTTRSTPRFKQSDLVHAICRAQSRRRSHLMPTLNYAPDGLSGAATRFPSETSPFQNDIGRIAGLIKSKNGAWDGINPESVARMRLQNRFQTGLEIARYTADIMRRDMAAYDADPAQLHPVAGLLARLHRPAEDDLDQEALRHDQAPLPLPLRLDGRRAALRVRPAARPVDAREDLACRR